MMPTIIRWVNILLIIAHIWPLRFVIIHVALLPLSLSTTKFHFLLMYCTIIHRFIFISPLVSIVSSSIHIILPLIKIVLYLCSLPIKAIILAATLVILTESQGDRWFRCLVVKYIWLTASHLWSSFVQVLSLGTCFTYPVYWVRLFLHSVSICHLIVASRIVYETVLFCLSVYWLENDVLVILCSLFVQNVHLAITMVCCNSEHLLTTYLIVPHFCVRSLGSHLVVVPIAHRVIIHVATVIHHLRAHRLKVIGIVSWCMPICLVWWNLSWSERLIIPPGIVHGCLSHHIPVLIRLLQMLNPIFKLSLLFG